MQFQATERHQDDTYFQLKKNGADDTSDISIIMNSCYLLNWMTEKSSLVMGMQLAGSKMFIMYTDV